MDDEVDDEESADDEEERDGATSYHFQAGEVVRWAMNPSERGALMPGLRAAHHDELKVLSTRFVGTLKSSTGVLVDVRRESDGQQFSGFDSSYFIPVDSEEITEWDEAIGKKEEEEVLDYDKGFFTDYD